MGSDVRVSANQTGLAMCTHPALEKTLEGLQGEVIFWSSYL